MIRSAWAPATWSGSAPPCAWRTTDRRAGPSRSWRPAPPAGARDRSTARRPAWASPPIPGPAPRPTRATGARAAPRCLAARPLEQRVAADDSPRRCGAGWPSRRGRSRRRSAKAGGRRGQVGADLGEGLREQQRQRRGDGRAHEQQQDLAQPPPRRHLCARRAAESSIAAKRTGFGAPLADAVDPPGQERGRAGRAAARKERGIASSSAAPAGG